MRSSKKTRWGVVTMAVLAGIVATMQIGKVPPAIGGIRIELALSLVTAGWVVSLFNAIGGAGGTAVGLVADRVGTRRMVLAGLALLCSGSIAGGLAGDAGGLLLARTLEGIGFVAIAVATPTIILAATAADRQRLVLAAWSCYMPIGMAIMMLAAPTLIAAYDWRGLWFVNAALLAAFAPAFTWATRHVNPTPHGKRSLADIKLTVIRPGPWLLAGSFAFYTVQWFGLMSWLPTFLTEELGFSSRAAAYWTALVIASNAIGNITGGLLLQRGVPRWRILFVAALALGIFGAGIFQPAVGPSLKLILAFGFSVIGGTLPGVVLAGAPFHSAAPTTIGATNGMILQGSNAGVLFGPPFVAAVVTGTGHWQATGWIMLGAGLAGAAIAVMLGQVERRMTAEAGQ